MSALEYLKFTSYQPFLIICVINMPKMTGRELRRTMDKDDAFGEKVSRSFSLQPLRANPKSMKLTTWLVKDFFKKNQHLTRQKRF